MREILGFFSWIHGGLAAGSFALFTISMSLNDKTLAMSIAAGLFLFATPLLVIGATIARLPGGKKESLMEIKEWNSLNVSAFLAFIVGFYIFCWAVGGFWYLAIALGSLAYGSFLIKGIIPKIKS